MSDPKYPSVSEIIGTIKRSDLLNVIVEGKDDILVYRKLEKIYFYQTGKKNDEIRDTQNERISPQ